MSKSADDGSIYIGQIFATKEDIVHVVEVFSIRKHQQYFVYKSLKTLLKLKCKRLNECPWSRLAAKRKGDDLWEIRKYKGPHTCFNLLMNRDHRQLDVLYISTIIK